MGNITVRESISQLQQLMREAEELRLALIHNLHQFIEFDPALAIDIRAAYKPQNDKFIERVKSVAGAQEYAHVQKHFAGQHVLLTTMQEDLETLQSLADHIGNIVTKLSNSNVVSNKDHAIIMQELATRWEKIICPHDDPVKVREYRARGVNVDITDYCGISDFTSEVVFHEIRLQKIEAALQAKEEFNQIPTTHPVTQQATENVDDAVFAEVDRIAQEVADFAFGRYGSQFMLYKQLIRNATTCERTDDLIKELTGSLIATPAMVKITNSNLNYENPWFTTLNDMAMNKANLMQLERELLSYQERVTDSHELLIKVNYALQQVRADFARIDSNRFKNIVKQGQEIQAWAAKDKPSRNVIYKITGMNNERFDAVLDQANSRGYEQILRNNYMRFSHVMAENFIPQLVSLRSAAQKSCEVAQTIEFSKFRDPLSKATSMAALMKVKADIDAARAQFSDMYQLRGQILTASNKAHGWFGLNAGVIVTAQNKLCAYAESVAEHDVEKAERIYNFILGFGNHQQSRQKTAWGRVNAELEGKLNVVRTNLYKPGLFKRSVNGFLDALSEYGANNAELLESIANMREQMVDEIDKQAILPILQTMLKGCESSCVHKYANGIGEVAVSIEQMIRDQVIADDDLVDVVRALRSYYLDLQDDTQLVHVENLQKINAMFELDRSFDDEPELSVVAMVMSKLDQLDHEVAAYIEVDKKIVAVEEQLKKEFNVVGVNVDYVEIDEYIVRIKAEQSAVNAKRIYDSLSRDIARCDYNVDMISSRINTLKEQTSIIVDIKALAYSDKCKELNADIKREISGLEKVLTQEITTRKQLKGHLNSAQQLKHELCFDEMPWHRRIRKAWAYGIKHPGEIVKNAREHKVKTAATLLGLAAVGVLTAKIALPIAAIGVAAKIATTAKVATILVGDAAIASASLANSAEEISDNMSEANSVEQQQAKNSAGALESNCYSSVASDIADEACENERDIAPALSV